MKLELAASESEKLITEYISAQDLPLYIGQSRTVSISPYNKDKYLITYKEKREQVIKEPNVYRYNDTTL